MKIYPSLISSDILNIEKTLKELDSECDGYHIDVMDDHFVPNLTWGPAFASEIRKKTKLPIHLHLMVDNPEDWIDRVLTKKVFLQEDDIFIVHHEVIVNYGYKVLKDIKNFCKVGVAINPETSADSVSGIADLDHVLVMSVNPGFSGQKFIPEVLEKIPQLIKKREDYGLKFTIGLDGGVSHSNIKSIFDIGVDEVGVASAIFSKENYLSALRDLYKNIEF